MAQSHYTSEDPPMPTISFDLAFMQISIKALKFQAIQFTKLIIATSHEEVNWSLNSVGRSKQMYQDNKHGIHMRYDSILTGQVPYGVM